MIWIAALLAFWGLCAAVPITIARIPFALTGAYWAASWLGQSFALPLLIIAVVLAVFAEGVALLVLAASALLLALAHWRNRQAGRTMLDAVGLRDVRISPFAGLTPLLTGASKVRRIRDIAYGDAGKRNLLDLVLPRTPPAKSMPVLVHVHGGGWFAGHKRQQALPLLHHLAARGWLCVDINYRLAPAHRFPTIISDVLRALAWVKAHAHEHGGDPSRIAITGGSAGGHLTALAALAHDDPALKSGFEGADCSVAAAIPLYGDYDLADRRRWFGKNHPKMEKFIGEKVMPGPVQVCPALWLAVSPIERIRKDAPPMLVVHGTGDTLLPHQGTRDFAAALGEVSAQPVRGVELRGIQHAWDFTMSALTWAHVRAVARFLAPLEQAMIPNEHRNAGQPHDPWAREEALVA